jgi:hypothetical protein
MPPTGERKRREPSPQKKFEALVADVTASTAAGASYDRERLATITTELVMLSGQLVEDGKIPLEESVQVKLAAYAAYKNAAFVNRDYDTVRALDPTIDNYAATLSLLTTPVEPQKSTKPAKTSAANTGGAKSS